MGTAVQFDIIGESFVCLLLLPRLKAHGLRTLKDQYIVMSDYSLLKMTSQD